MSKNTQEAVVQAAAGEVSPEARAELVVAEAAENAVALFTDPKNYSEFYQRIKDTVSGHPVDLSTPSGRDKVRSLAFRVTKAKTTLDKAGKALTEQWRKQTAEVNASRTKMVSELDQLADEVRAPLTAWEIAEDARAKRVSEEFDFYKGVRFYGDGLSSAEVEAYGREVVDRPLAPEVFQDRLDEAQAAKDEAVLVLLRLRDRLKQEEADRAELEKLRRENEERQARETQEREEREAEEARKAEAERLRLVEVECKEAEERRVAEAAEKAREEALEAERKAQAAIAEEQESARKAEQEERDRAHKVQLEEAQRAADQAEEERRKAQEKLDQEAREREEREKVAAEEADAQRKREADKAHRRTIAGEAAADLANVFAEAENDARKLDPKDRERAICRFVVLAIANREIRHISIQF